MAKKAASAKAKSTKPAAPDSLELRLFAPGMSLLHRAGLGGVACTLRYIEREVRDQRLADDQLPGGPWANGEPPWIIEPQRIVLKFGEPQLAKEFLKRLFQLAFQTRDGLLFLPGQYEDKEPSKEVRAYLQQGVTLTFLQHGLTRTLDKTDTTETYEIDDKTISFQFKQCSAFKHQKGWADLVDEKSGCLSSKPSEVVGPMSPGSVVRHVAFTSTTKIEETVDRLLPLYFALVGCLALPINRGSGVLIIPEVEDLEEFPFIRPALTPKTARDCQITSAGDAALQGRVRIRQRLSAGAAAEVQVQAADAIRSLPGCHASVFQPTAWASQQKSRVQTLVVDSADETQMDRLDVFATALGALKPRVVTRVVKESQGRGKAKVETERQESFWSDSVVRPLIADNLARGQPWYRNFINLMTRIDPVSKKPIRDRLHFEKEGLRTMTEQLKELGESAVVRAVHEAMRRRYAQIGDETKTNSAARKKRWQGEYDKWRLAFAGAKTPDQFRTAICDLFSRAGTNKVLQADWQAVIQLLCDGKWQLARDLALIGLASYSGKATEETDDGST